MAALLPTLVAVLAGISGLMGLVVLESFFRDKIKDLFDNSFYLVFFFLVVGYGLYSLGELSYYLANLIFTGRSAVGIENLYWVLGGIVILISFAVLSWLQARKTRQFQKFFLLLIIGLILALVSVFIIGKSAGSFFNYLFPLVSSLIVAFSLCSLLFSSALGYLARPLQVFFLASSLILVGDLLFSFSAFAAVSDIFYLFGYGLSAAAFLLLRLRMHALGNQN